MQEQLEREKGDALRDPVKQQAEDNKEELQHQLLSAFSAVTTHQAEENERYHFIGSAATTLKARGRE